MKTKAWGAIVMVTLAWMLWVKTHEAGKPPVWETKGPFDDSIQCKES